MALKTYEGRGLWFHLMFVFLSRAKESVSLWLPTWILLNQDRKLLNTWGENSNHLGSVNCRLQYSAQLSHVPMSCSHVPTPRASICGRVGKSCSAFHSLGLFYCAPLSCQPFPPDEAVHDALLIIFNQRDKSYLPQLSVLFFSLCW